jgi:CheY-like chemotaxis protein
MTWNMDRRLEASNVDNNADNRRLVSLLMPRAGFVVTCCADGAEAVALCIDQARHFDIVLLDVMMPIMDGVETLRILRSATLTAAMPIVCSSANNPSPDLNVGTATGCDRFLLKPFRHRALFAIVDALLAEKGIIRAGEILGAR